MLLVSWLNSPETRSYFLNKLYPQAQYIQNQQFTNIISGEIKFDGQEMTCVGKEMTRVSTEIDRGTAAMTKNLTEMKSVVAEITGVGSEMSCVSTEINFVGTEMTRDGAEIDFVGEEMTGAFSETAPSFKEKGLAPSEIHTSILDILFILLSLNIVKTEIPLTNKSI